MGCDHLSYCQYCFLFTACDPSLGHFSQFDFRSTSGSFMLCFDSARKHPEYDSQLDSARLLLQMGDSNQGWRARSKTSVHDLAFVLVMSGWTYVEMI